MDITLLTPDNVYIIREHLSEIMAAVGRLFAEEQNLDTYAIAPDLAAIGESAGKIFDMLRDVYYVFRCSQCDEVYVVKQSDLELMTKRCKSRPCSYQGEVAGHMIFVEITKKQPDGAIVRGSF